jgi:hypothetical protein
VSRDNGATVPSLSQKNGPLVRDRDDAIVAAAMDEFAAPYASSMMRANFQRTSDRVDQFGLRERLGQKPKPVALDWQVELVTIHVAHERHRRQKLPLVQHSEQISGFHARCA